MQKAKSVDDYIKNSSHWNKELLTLRELLLSTDLEEGIKWGAPCYMINGKNVVGMSGFKSYFGLWFHQGALLSDEKKKLINAQEGKTRALRQWRMTSAQDIKPGIIKSYLKEAIENARTGKEIRAKRNSSDVEVPPELQGALDRHPKVAANFKQFTPGRRREYANYINEAKRADTKARRVAKILPMIASGGGLNDRYR